MEVLIIGGGPGGYVAALYGAKRGLKVTLVEKAELGGVCLNRGCIPTKTILHSANLFHRAKDMTAFGIHASVTGVDYSIIIKRQTEITTRLRSGVEFLLKNAGVTVIRGEASMTGDRRVRVTSDDGERLLTADRIVLATGSVPLSIPVAPVDGDVIMNSDHALALTELPESMAIVGGGVIGCELAQAFSRLGCKVTIIEAMPRILPGLDADVSNLLRKTLERDGIVIHTDARLTHATKTEAGVTISIDMARTGTEVSARKLLVAVGRKPRLEGLGLESVGVVCENGYVKVDSTMQTNIHGLYAIGDMTGGVQLAHAASFGGIVAIRHMLGEKTGMSGVCVPMCVYTEPEIACVGLTLDAAKNSGLNCRSGTFPLSANPRAVIEGATDGFAKMVLDDDGTMIGAHLVGPNVTEMISLLGGLINFQTTAADMEEILFAHPSVSEIIGEGVLAADKLALHIP